MIFGALRSHDRIRGYTKYIKTICLISMILVLSGCGLWPFGDTDSAPRASAQNATMENGQNAPPPPSYGQSPASASTPGAAAAQASSPQNASPMPSPPPAPSDPLEAAGRLELSPGGSLGALGLNMETFFADEIRSDDERIARVEKAVTAIQKDLKTLAPPIQRLISVEADIQELVAQLQAFMNTPPPTESPPSTASPANAASQTPQSLHPPKTASKAAMSAQNVSDKQSGGHTAKAVDGPTQVNRVRLGEHKDKTRIVLDVSGTASYRYDLDNREHILVIELAGAGWAGKKSWQGKSPLLASYTVYETDGGGSRLVIPLKHDASVVYETTIKPNGYDDYRIVIDLFSGAVHKK